MGVMAKALEKIMKADSCDRVFLGNPGDMCGQFIGVVAYYRGLMLTKYADGRPMVIEDFSRGYKKGVGNEGYSTGLRPLSGFGAMETHISEDVAAEFLEFSNIPPAIRSEIYLRALEAEATKQA